jgi:DNA-binding NarL/FixJ family response regulator
MTQLVVIARTDGDRSLGTMVEETRVLIVDDIPEVRHGLSTLVRLAGKKTASRIVIVGEAQNGIEAIKQAQLLVPDVILMDLEMPVMDGYSATQQIKSMHPEILIIALTIHDDPVSRSKVKQAGADAFIEKGAPLNELLQAIHK